MLFGGPAVPAVDCIFSNLVQTIGIVGDKMLLAGYSTGSGGIPWPRAAFDAHPGTVRICQDPSASDETADLIDVEQFAASNSVVPGWVRRAENSWQQALRPGQRWPAAYTSASNVTPMVNTLLANGISSNTGLVIANWNLSDPQAIADVLSATGPFPVVGIQWRGGGQIGRPYDLDVFSEAWLNGTSGRKEFAHTTDPGDELGGLAAQRNMNVISWLILQKSINPNDADNLAGRAVARTGSRWWSVHP